MEEAKDYKAYLKALKEATKKKPKVNKPVKTKQLACGGMGIAVKGGKFEGVK
jgi:hypothetical protein|tara:strand:+ start:72 stop:227 length:156 start_codon:yes stop_codon:yes gene_type:complete